jgi:hypothetical protein
VSLRVNSSLTLTQAARLSTMASSATWLSHETLYALIIQLGNVNVINPVCDQKIKLTENEPNEAPLNHSSSQ